jgi:hypothetical protein
MQSSVITTVDIAAITDDWPATQRPPEPWVALPPPVTWTVEPWGGRQTYSRFVELYHKYKSTPHAAR